MTLRHESRHWRMVSSHYEKWTHNGKGILYFYKIKSAVHPTHADNKLYLGTPQNAMPLKSIFFLLWMKLPL